eukprot:2117020-Rhodomonas_salina.2
MCIRDRLSPTTIRVFPHPTSHTAESNKKLKRKTPSCFGTWVRRGTPLLASPRATSSIRNTTKWPDSSVVLTSVPVPGAAYSL